ncbi:MAG TPA: Arc family DNA-binding protein, partial [Candidatus Hydrogenedentes bacterium]|nr:Arc family DNA-binding protein [Candidatus Hydrogenedentota bacterium]
MAEKKSFLLRLPPELLEDLNRWAADELRSLNGQIEYLLRDAVR